MAKMINIFVDSDFFVFSTTPRMPCNCNCIDLLGNIVCKLQTNIQSKYEQECNGMNGIEL